MRVLFLSILTMLFLFSCKSVKKTQHAETSEVAVSKVDTSSKKVIIHVDTTVKKGVTTIKTTTIEIDNPVYTMNWDTVHGNVAIGYGSEYDTLRGGYSTPIGHDDNIAIGGWHDLGSGGPSSIPIGSAAGRKPSGNRTFSADRIRAQVVEETIDTSTHAGISDQELLEKEGFAFDSANKQVTIGSNSTTKGGNSWLVYTVIGVAILFLIALFLAFKKGFV